jgi:hypothetical protein
MSNFGYKDAKGKVTRVPVRYGDVNRQVASILRKNSENSMPTAPLISCYIKDLQFDITRLQDPTFVSKVHIREREFDSENNVYLNTQGKNYTVERIMPSPYQITFQADMWFTNTEQKLQIFEQIAVLFNPSLEIQTTDNYIDWTSLSVLTLDNITFSSRSIPQGVEQDIDVLTMMFKAPIWITPPAKVKKLGIVTKIITDVFALNQDELQNNYSTPESVLDFGEKDSRIVVTPGNFDLLVLDNAATLVKSSTLMDSLTSHPSGATPWFRLLDLYPGKFRAGLSQLRLRKSDGNEIVAYISLDPMDDQKMLLNFDQDTIPTDTYIQGRGTIDAIIDPQTYNPRVLNPGTRFLILENINHNIDYENYDGPDAWKNSDGSEFQANANDIIEWDGGSWNVVFNSLESSDLVYITNTYTGIQYKWDSNQWTKSFEGVYDQELWRLIL